MRKSTIAIVCISFVMAWVSFTVMAQTKGGAQRAPASQTMTKGDRLHTQDRMKDMLHDQDRLKDQDKLKDQDQDQLQDRDRLHDQDGQPIYGIELMTPAEITAYMTRMRSLETVQERNAYREQHRNEIQVRARERGVTIPSGNGQGTQQQGSGNGN